MMHRILFRAINVQVGEDEEECRWEVGYLENGEDEPYTDCGQICAAWGERVLGVDFDDGREVCAKVWFGRWDDPEMEGAQWVIHHAREPYQNYRHGYEHGSDVSWLIRKACSWSPFRYVEPWNTNPFVLPQELHQTMLEMDDGEVWLMKIEVEE